MVVIADSWWLEVVKCRDGKDRNGSERTGGFCCPKRRIVFDLGRLSAKLDPRHGEIGATFDPISSQFSLGSTMRAVLQLVGGDVGSHPPEA